ncbi:fasciclin domain-containing protein [Indioceanicola profundi]|uniref:fasciclin domain-containing protein n=1 Tax=Indioceanicola profundi TaxID=2220096 RepID=UPI000E6ABB1D|nr:fasciclin domain-containing protein [Indioceanicola profundi]
MPGGCGEPTSSAPVPFASFEGREHNDASPTRDGSAGGRGACPGRLRFEHGGAGRLRRHGRRCCRRPGRRSHRCGGGRGCRGAGGSQADRVLENGASGGIEATDRTLAQSLERRSGFSTFTRLADASGLAQELGGGGSYTIFAPTDEAFNALPAELRQRLDTDRELLRNVLNQHVVSGQALAADQLPQEVRTAGGTPIRVALADGRPVLAAAGEPGAQAPDPEVALGGGPGTARIVTGNIAFAEGVVHGIDQVLLPAGMR